MKHKETDIKLTKEEFIQYLKYLYNILNDLKVNSEILVSLKELIEKETLYSPSVYYYHEISEEYNLLILNKFKKSVIRWTRISTWKAYIRKNKIKKLLE